MSGRNPLTLSADEAHAFSAAFTARSMQILNIHANETRMVALITILMFCASAGGAIGSPGIEALFFSRFGVQYLPQMYILLGAVTALTSLGITALLGRIDRTRLYVWLPLVLAIVILAARLVLIFELSWFYPIIWLGMNVFWVLLDLFTWGLAGVMNDTRQAKRLFPLYGAGGILGLAAGGLMTKPLVDWLGTENLLYIWAASLIIAFLVCRAAIGKEVRPRRSHIHKPAPVLEGVKRGYRFVRKSRLMGWMSLAAVLFALLYYSLVFPFSKAVTAEFAREDAITAFLGVFQGLSTAGAFLASILLANRLYARAGFMTTILVEPVIYLLGFSILSIRAIFPALILFRFTQLVWSLGVSGGANQAMYNVVSPDQREQVRAFVRGVANPAGVSLVGLLLLAGERFLPSNSMYFIGVVAAVPTVFLVWRARGVYGRALLDALRSGRPHIFLGEGTSFGGFRSEATAMTALVAGISSPNVVERRVSAEILANLAAPEATDALVLALNDVDVDVRANSLHAIARAKAAPAILEVVSCLGDPEAKVRVAAIQALRKLAAYPDGLARHVLPLLNDPKSLVRVHAAAALLSIDPSPDAEQVIRAMAAGADVQARIEALRALVDWNSPQAFEIASSGLSDSSPAVRKTAAAVLARIDAEGCIGPLIAALGDVDQGVRLAAAAALGASGESAVQRVIAALSDPRLESGALTALGHLPVQRFVKPLLSYARQCQEKALDYHRLWQSSLRSSHPDERTRLAADALRNRALYYGTHALRALGLLGDPAGMSMAIENLSSPSAAQRANALEMLESLGEAGIVRPLLNLWEVGEKPFDLEEGWLVRILRDEDAWLRACAALAAGHSQDAAVWKELALLAQSDSDELVRLTAQATLKGVSNMETLTTLSVMEKILFLRKVPIFVDLDPADLRQIAEITGEHTFTDGQVIAEQGELGDEMYIIVSGRVRVVVKTEAGEEVEIVRRTPGECVGEMSILRRAPRMASLIAFGEVRILYIGQAAFEEILRMRPDASLAVMRVLCDRLAEESLPIEKKV
jgi:HEAT repeat protein